MNTKSIVDAAIKPAATLNKSLPNLQKSGQLKSVRDFSELLQAGSKGAPRQLYNGTISAPMELHNGTISAPMKLHNGTISAPMELHNGSTLGR